MTQCSFKTVLLVLLIALVAAFSTPDGDNSPRSFFDVILESSYKGVLWGTKKVINKGHWLSSYVASDSCRKPPSSSVARLSDHLKARVCGQEFLIDELIGYLAIRDANTDAPMVMSWHGATGIGKTYLTSLMEDYLAVHSIDQVHEMTVEHVNDILERCKYPVIILEDVDRASAAVTSLVTHFTTHRAGIRKARHAVFILTMNLGADAIAQYVGQPSVEADMLDRLQSASRLHLPRLKRAILHGLSEGEDKAEQAAAASGGGGGGGEAGSVAGWGSERRFWNSLVERNLIMKYLPFLPLQPQQVQCCLRNGITDLRSRPLDDHLVLRNVATDQVSELLSRDENIATYEKVGNLKISEGGCRHVKESMIRTITGLAWKAKMDMGSDDSDKFFVDVTVGDDDQLRVNLAKINKNKSEL
jgi:hypothetical protein